MFEVAHYSNVKSLCYGCGTCAGVCPNNAITMHLDREKGIYLPQIARNKCNNCGIHTQVCPWRFFKKEELDLHDKELNDKIIGNYLGCYLGYSVDPELRKIASSGGLVSALSIFGLEEKNIDGVLVTKMDEYPLKPVSFIAKTKDEILSATGSKYTPIPANTALREILKEDGKYAVVGLPCHIQGIRKAEKINKKLNERIVLHFGLICSGNISLYGTNLLLKSLNRSRKCGQYIKKN